jgi:hypothetical protein
MSLWERSRSSCNGLVLGITEMRWIGDDLEIELRLHVEYVGNWILRGIECLPFLVWDHNGNPVPCDALFVFPITEDFRDALQIAELQKAKPVCSIVDKDLLRLPPNADSIAVLLGQSGLATKRVKLPARAPKSGQPEKARKRGQTPNQNIEQLKSVGSSTFAYRPAFSFRGIRHEHSPAKPFAAEAPPGRLSLPKMPS